MRCGFCKNSRKSRFLPIHEESLRFCPFELPIDSSLDDQKSADLQHSMPRAQKYRDLPQSA
jgi:hypothetical protein